MNQLTCPHCNHLLKPEARFCSNCGQKFEAIRAEQQVTPPPSAAKVPKKVIGKRAKIVYTVSALLLFGFFTYLFSSHLPGGAHPVIGQQPSVAMAAMYMNQTLQQQPTTAEVRNGKIRIQLAELLDKKILEFSYQDENRTIPLLAYISGEGKLVTAIRMCEPCNSQTFRIEGSELGCGNCETKWKLNNLEGLQGSCQKYPPAPIPSKVDGNIVEIDELVVKNWKLRI